MRSAPNDPTAERRDEVLKRMLNTPPQPKTSLKKKKTASSDESDKGVSERRDEVVKRMLATPPQKHAPKKERREPKPAPNQP